MHRRLHTGIIDQLRAELQRIGRPLVREEFSYVPGIQQLSDRVTTLVLQNNEPCLLCGADDPPMVLSDALARGWLDHSDVQTLVYMLRQIS